MRLSNMMRGMFGVDPLTKQGDDEYYKAARTFSNAARAYLGFDPLDSRYSVMDEEGLKQNQREEQAYKSADLAGIVHDVLPPKAALTGIGLGITAGWRALHAPDYQKALKMMDEGKAYREILDATGVHAKPNRPVFHEISDDLSELTIPDDVFQKMLKGEETPLSKGTLGNILKHDELYKNYPELKNYKVVFDPYMDKTERGYLDINKKTIHINPHSMQNPIMAKSVLLHELDHAVAKIENFPAGGSPENMIIGNEAHQLYSGAKYAKEDAIKEYNNLETWYFNSPAELKKRQKEWEAKIRKYAAEERYWQRLSKYRQENMPPGVDAREQAYFDLWGERTARATQLRANMTPEQRLKNPGPYENLELKNPEFYDSNKDTVRPALMGTYDHDPMDFELDYNVDDVFPPTIR